MVLMLRDYMRLTVFQGGRAKVGDHLALIYEAFL